MNGAYDLIRGFLLQAEIWYGPRTPGITFSVEERHGGPLQAVFNPGAAHVAVHLPANLNQIDLEGQLAHESFHVFSPATPEEAKILDEGLATQFAFRVRNYRPPVNQWSYQAAWAVVEWLNYLRQNAIQELRHGQPRVALVEENEILRVCSRLPRYWANFLIQRFYQ